MLRERSDAPLWVESEAGLFHVAIRVPDRASLADALTRIRRAGATLTGASDHLVSEALYLRDPTSNGVEVYCDRPREEWPRTDDGGVAMDTIRFDLDNLTGASEATGAGDGDGAAVLLAGTDVGHVHLEVTDLPSVEAFYRRSRPSASGLDPEAVYKRSMSPSPSRPTCHLPRSTTVSPNGPNSMPSMTDSVRVSVSTSKVRHPRVIPRPTMQSE